MKKLLLSILAVISLGSIIAWGANYTVTQGAGTTFGSLVVSTVNYAQMLMCDPTTPSQCAAVDASGIQTVKGTVTAAQATAANLNATVVQGTAANLNATVAQPTAASLNATVVGTGTFAVQAAQSGTWNITNVSGTVSLPTGASTSANQTTEIASLATIATNTGAAIPAGTNVIGALTGATSGGFTTLTMTNLLTTPNAIKASAGQVAKLYCYNPNASVAYVQIFNVASGSVTPGTTKPSQTYGIPATNAAGFSVSPVGDQYSTAISAVATTTASGGTPPSTGIDCSVSFF